MGATHRAEHVGSFLRRAAGSQAGADPERLRTIEDRPILRVLGRQRELGFEVVTDGELRRRNFMSDFTDAVEGFDLGGAVARSWKGATSGVSSVTGIVTDKVRASGA